MHRPHFRGFVSVFLAISFSGFCFVFWYVFPVCCFADVWVTAITSCVALATARAIPFFPTFLKKEGWGGKVRRSPRAYAPFRISVRSLPLNSGCEHHRLDTDSRLVARLNEDDLRDQGHPKLVLGVPQHALRRCGTPSAHHTSRGPFCEGTGVGADGECAPLGLLAQ